MRRKIFPIAGLLLGLISCAQHEGKTALLLPSTPVLQITTRWALVDVPVLRLRDTPTTAGAVLSLLSAGDRVEVLAQTVDEMEVDGKINLWYQVNYNGIRGWMCGAYMTEVNIGTRNFFAPSAGSDLSNGSTQVVGS